MSTILIAAALCAVASFGCAGPAVAQAVPCPADARLSIDAETPEQATHVCKVVARLRTPMADCHLEQRRPLVIRIVDELTHPEAGCMGSYDCRDDSISVAPPETLATRVSDDSIWRRIAPGALFDSLIAHELAHAFLDQAECRGIPCYADHEYIAYAMQIQSLSTKNRAAILQGHKVTDPTDTGRLNDFIAQAAPNHFAQAVWLHFSRPENGCAFVGRLIRGDATLWEDWL